MEGETKHTPGPWSSYDETGSDGLFPVTVKSDDDDLDIATMAHYARSREECDANAQLMAAAPELLAACKQLIRLLTGITDWEAAARDQLAYDEQPYHFLARAIDKAVLDAHRE